MGLFRIILFTAVVWIVLRLLARALSAPPSTQPPQPGGEEYTPLTRCSLCGAHIPQRASGAAAICERCRSR